MPIPKPGSTETKNEFISRCMEDPVMVKEYGQKQRIAICEGAWGKKSNMVARRRMATFASRKDLILEKTLNGRKHIVAPVVCIVAGVHNSEYIDYTELAAFPESWCARPLPVDHPVDNNGEAVTAGSPKVMEESVIGFLFNVVARDDIQGISGEIWVDIEKAATVAGGDEVLRKLQAGDNLEVSTAYFTVIDNIPGEWKNPKDGTIEKYVTSQTQIRPDHLALLPFDSGACSWKDGCGSPRINSDKIDHTLDSKENMELSANILSSSRRPSFSGTESLSWASVNKSFAAYAKAYLKSTGSSDSPPAFIKDATAGMKGWIASKTLLGDKAADTNRDLIFFPVVNPGTGKLNEGALRAVLGGRGSQANIPASALSSAQDMAKKLLKSEFEVDMTENKIAENAVLTANGKQLGKALAGALAAHSHESGSDETLGKLAAAAGIDDATMQLIVSGELDFIPRYWINIFSAILDIDPYELYMACSNDNTNARYENNSGKVGDTMTITDNLEQNGSKETCAPCQKTLKGKVLEILQSLGFKGTETKEGKKTMDINAEAKKAKVDAIIASDKNQFAEAHRDWLTNLSDEQLIAFEAPVAQTVEAKPEVKTEVAAVAVTTVAAPVAQAQAAEVKTVVMSKSQILETLGVSEDDLKAAKSLNDDRKSARNAKVAEIAALENCKFSKAELEAFSDATLDKTFEMLQPAPFRVAAGVKRPEDSKIPATPKILTADAGVYGVDYAVQTSKNKGAR